MTLGAYLYNFYHLIGSFHMELKYMPKSLSTYIRLTCHEYGNPNIRKIREFLRVETKKLFIRFLKEHGCFSQFVHMFYKHLENGNWSTRSIYNNLDSYLQNTDPSDYISLAFPWDDVDGSDSNRGQFQKWEELCLEWGKLMKSEIFLSTDIKDLDFLNI